MSILRHKIDLSPDFHAYQSLSIQSLNINGKKWKKIWDEKERERMENECLL